MFETRQELEMQIPKFPDNQRATSCNDLRARDGDRDPRFDLAILSTRERIAIYEATLSSFKLDTDGKG